MNEYYFKNLKPINTIKNSSNDNLSEKFNYAHNEDYLNNMVINSNLDTENLIK